MAEDGPPQAVSEIDDARSRFADVFSRHNAPLLRLAYLLCGDRHQAEEIVAEAFAKVWPHWQRGRVRDEGMYLRRAIVNEVNSFGRRAVVAERFSRREGGERGDQTPNEAATDRLAIVAALAQLPKRQRAVIVLRFYDDLTEAATGAALGMRPGTVKSQTSRGLARLRTILDEEQR